MPLGIEMQLGFVDEDDPFAVLVERQGAQEQEQLELTGAEQVDLETIFLGTAEEDIK